MKRLPEHLEKKLLKLGTSLVNQGRARLLVAPTQDRSGYWFGGGNMVRDPHDQSLLLIGRWRDAGDSRTGLAAGPRGRELAILRSTDEGRSFAKICSWNKADLHCDSEVLSIEGSALRVNRRRAEVLVATEKVGRYPRRLASYQKPGTGIWGIDRFAAPRVERLHPQGEVEPLLRGPDPAYLHVKDPSLSPGPRGQALMIYCAHPFSWTSSTSGYAILTSRGCTPQSPDFFPRGPAWDVAAARITCRMAVPRIGAFADLPAISLCFYDGAECLRQLEPHQRAVSRPRGYSCEELGGLAYGFDRAFPQLHRLSQLAPLFTSPRGTGCSRYVSVLREEDGALFATWERSETSQAQPLVGHRLSAARVRALLS